MSEFEQQKGAGLTSVAKEMVDSIKDPDMQATEVSTINYSDHMTVM